MTEKKCYSVSELAELIGVPRTTINDWLARYPEYLESELRGKRRVYTERTVTVLREVAALREAGQTGFEIDEALAANHAVNAEVAPPPEEAPASASADTAAVPPPAADAALAVLDADAQLPQSMPGVEAGLRFAAELRQVIDVLQSQQKETEALLLAARGRFRRMVWLSAVGMVGMSAAIVAGFLWLSHYGATREKNLTAAWHGQLDTVRSDWQRQTGELTGELTRQAAAQLQETREAAREQLTAEQQRAERALAARDAELAKVREAEAAQRLEILQSLERQKAEFERQVATLQQNLNGQSQAELAELRAEFTRQQQRYLAELEELKRSNAALLQAAEAAEAARQAAAKTPPPPAVPAPPPPEKPAENLQTP